MSWTSVNRQKVRDQLIKLPCLVKFNRNEKLAYSDHTYVHVCTWDKSRSKRVVKSNYIIGIWWVVTDKVGTCASVPSDLWLYELPWCPVGKPIIIHYVLNTPHDHLIRRWWSWYGTRSLTLFRNNCESSSNRWRLNDGQLRLLCTVILLKPKFGTVIGIIYTKALLSLR